jgi:Zn-dependent peptidase ImmA (M78 family)/DNA-binding XRE family transcriptional regulator
MFSGVRLSLARKRAGLSKKRFAETLGVHPRTIIRWETDEREPEESELRRIAEILNFPVSFFDGPEPDVADIAGASFRSLSSMSAGERDSALAAGSFGFVLDDWISERYDLPREELEDLRFESPEGAARALREKWLIGERPISNMVKLLEAKGVRVFSLAENVKTVDAFSMWRRGRPYVFLNCFKTPEHQRFDAAHELGHLVLHRHGGPRGREAEDEANKFASSFLMPAADVRAALPMVLSLSQLIRAKARWKVSLAALNYRVHKLGLVSDWEYRSFCIDIQTMGYRTSEPEGIQREMSTIWSDIIADLRAQGISKTDISRETGLPVYEIENLVFGMTHMLSIEGGAAGSGRREGKLELVIGNDN